MTTYRAIASTETDPQAPITSALMKAFQDNLLAVLELDGTAPQLGDSIALIAAGGVGSYGFFNNGANTVAFGSTLAGSNLNPADSAGNATASARSGTWRCMGKTNTPTDGERTTLWLRIS